MPLFDGRDARALQCLVQPLRRALIVAGALERRSLPEAPAHVVLDPRGRVRFASPAGAAWLSRPALRETLARAAKSAAEDRAPGFTALAGSTSSASRATAAASATWPTSRRSRRCACPPEPS